MQAALDERNGNAALAANDVDYTPSGVVPIARARRRADERALADPFIEAQLLDRAVAAVLALEELAASDREWDDDEITRDFDREIDGPSAMPPVELAGDEWDDEAITTRYDAPTRASSDAGPTGVSVARALAADLQLVARKRGSKVGRAAGFVDGCSTATRRRSPWVIHSGLERLLSIGAERDAAPRWRRWLFVGAVTLTLEAALLGSLAWALA